MATSSSPGVTQRTTRSASCLFRRTSHQSIHSSRLAQSHEHGFADNVSLYTYGCLLPCYVHTCHQTHTSPSIGRPARTKQKGRPTKTKEPVAKKPSIGPSRAVPGRPGRAGGRERSGGSGGRRVFWWAAVFIGSGGLPPGNMHAVACATSVGSSEIYGCGFN